MEEGLRRDELRIGELGSGSEGKQAKPMSWFVDCHQKAPHTFRVGLPPQIIQPENLSWMCPAAWVLADP